MNKSVYLDSEIVVIGLGYVGFPLATKLSSVFKVIGFDISSNRINELKEGKDLTTLDSIESTKLSCGEEWEYIKKHKKRW